MSSFTIADYVIFILSVLVSVCIGLLYAYRGRKEQTTEAYLLGNRKLRVLPVALSVAVTLQSGITMLGMPAETYMFGIIYIWTAGSYVIAALFSMRILVKLIHPLRITSFNEYYSLRFQTPVPRLVATAFGILYIIFYMAVVIFAPATAIEAVTPFPVWSSIVIVAVISMVYTSIGGMKAVIWTDVFQMLVITIGTITIMVRSAAAVGGIGKVFEIASEHGRLNTLKSTENLSDRSPVVLFIGGILYLLGYTFNQMTTQRVVSVATKREAGRVLIISTVVVTSFVCLACLLGIFAFSYFQTIGCDPLAGGLISNANQIVPYMAAQIFKSVPGLSGLYIAALFSASLSTMSSGLNSLTALTIEDFVKPYVKDLTESRSTVLAKIIVVIYGTVIIGVSFLTANIKGPLTQIAASALSSFSGATNGMFILSVFFKRTTTKGLLIGALCGASFVSWISIGQILSETQYREMPLPPATESECLSSLINNSTHWLNQTLEYQKNQTLKVNGKERYIEDVLPLNNDAFDHNLHALYPRKLEIKETTELSTAPSYLDLLISVSNGTFFSKLYDKRDDFDFRMKRTALGNLYSLCFILLPGVAILTTVIVGAIFSVLTGLYVRSTAKVIYGRETSRKNEKPGKSKPEVDEKYTMPLSDLVCLPQKIKKFCYCDINKKRRLEDDVAKTCEETGREDEPLQSRTEKERNAVV